MSSINQTNMPIVQISRNGVALPEEGEVLQGVIQDFKNAFGEKLKLKNSNGDLLLSTPQGQLVSSIAAMISDRNRLLAYYVNQVDPNYAVGRMQDAIGRIYFLERRVATSTMVTARCRGVAGTVIPVGTKAKDKQGNIYHSIAEGILIPQIVNVVDDNGKYIYVDKKDNTIIVPETNENKVNLTQEESCADIIFECEKKGPITCIRGSLTERYQAIQGWVSLINITDGTVGNDDETQAQFEQRRRQSVAHNSLNSVDSMMSALLKLDVVEDVYIIENYENEATGSKNTKEQENTDGVKGNDSNTTTEKMNAPSEDIKNDIVNNQENTLLNLKPHSIYVCVSLTKKEYEIMPIDPKKPGDVVKQIAQTIWRKKAPGCALNGAVSVYVKDDTKGINGVPLYGDGVQPEYLINFDYAKRVPFYIRVNISKPQQILGNPIHLIQDKIYSIFTGQTGSRKPRIGSRILASQFYCPVQSLGEWVNIISIKIDTVLREKDLIIEDVIQMRMNEMPILEKENIVVKIIDEEDESKDEASNGS